MNSEALIETLTPIVDAPGGIEQIRKLVLQLAVRGRLSSQEPEDEPAPALLAQLQIAREQMVSRRQGKRLRSDPKPEGEGVEHDLPGTWEWAPLGDICDLRMGQSPPGSSYREYSTGDGVPFIQGCAEFTGTSPRPTKRTTSPRVIAPAGSILISVRAPVGRINTASSELCIGRGLAAAVPLGEFSPEMIRIILESAGDYLNAQSTGTTFKAISGARLGKMAVPVPPLAEQHRIVSKVHDLMKLCDELESRRAKKAQTRLNLATSSLRRLADSDPSDLTESWKFFEKTIDRQLAPGIGDLQVLETLRRTILDLAVRGRLSVPDQSDEDVSEMLEIIKAERSRIVATKAIRPPKQLPAITAGEVPFDVPDRWEWARLGEISDGIQYGFTASAQFGAQGNYFLRITDISHDGRVDWGSVPRCEISPDEVSRYELKDGDLLIARTGGTIGKSFLVNSPPSGAVFASYLIRIRPAANIHPAFARVFTGTTLYWSQLRAASAGTGQPNVNGSNLAKLLVPVPPSREQIRIVETVDRLMSICDEMERQLQTATLSRTGLANSVPLHV